MFQLTDIQKSQDGLRFQETLQLTYELKARNREVLDLSPVTVEGVVRYESGLFLLDYQMSYDITLASSRSMAPVLLSKTEFVNEVFVADEAAAKEQDLIDEELVLVLEGDTINLAESVADNILLTIPIKVLTPEEEENEELPQGSHWTVLSEADYANEQQAKKEAENPFAQLSGLFDDED